MTERFRCSAAAVAAGEELYATASHVRRWLLLEEPSGWGRDAVLQCRLAPEIAVALRARARSVGARLLLIRRHGRYQPEARTCIVAVTTPAVQRVERFVVDQPADVLDLDLTPLRSDAAVGGQLVDHPMFLVCTNGRHDPCCAELGRPVAQALDAVLGEQVWESSHFGGDRFAGNVVCLPDGVYYGRVSPLNAVRLAQDYADGLLHLDHYRGRCSVPFSVQAAEHFARRQLGLTGVADLRASGYDDVGDQVTQAVFAGDGRTWTVTVERFEAPAAQLTCHAAELTRAPRYRLLALERAA